MVSWYRGVCLGIFVLYLIWLDDRAFCFRAYKMMGKSKEYIKMYEEKKYKLCQTIKYDGMFCPGQTMKITLKMQLPPDILKKKVKSK